MLDIVSDAWAFLIIREAFFGTRTFEAFRSALEIPRATLTDRLRKLTRLEIFRQVPTHVGRRKEYRLTSTMSAQVGSDPPAPASRRDIACAS
jgi:DNA-binding HxlR family transcriptional regulator